VWTGIKLQRDPPNNTSPWVGKDDIYIYIYIQGIYANRGQKFFFTKINITQD